MKGVFWLASYLKSGNTWLRIFLANLLNDSNAPVDINRIDISNVSQRSTFDKCIGFESSDLTEEEIDNLRPEVHRYLGETMQGPSFLKTHDAYTCLTDGGPVFPTEGCLGVIYLVRNPLDVAVSLAHHSSLSLDRTIGNMGDMRFCLSNNPNAIRMQLTQKLLSWSGHVESWLNQTAIPVHLMRYEETLTDPVAAFGAVVRFAGIERDDDSIRRAVEFSSFNNLQTQERQVGFREKPAAASSFFRKGQVGSWQDALSLEQIEQIIHDHSETMHRLGYLDQNGKIVSSI